VVRVGSVWVPFRLKIETGQCGVNSRVGKVLLPTLVVPPSPDFKFVKMSCGYDHNLALVVDSEGGLKMVSWGVGWNGSWFDLLSDLLSDL